jgi:hypothetical protein
VRLKSSVPRSDELECPMPTRPRNRFILTVILSFVGCGMAIAGALLAAAGWTPGYLLLFAVPVAGGHALLRVAKVQEAREKA